MNDEKTENTLEDSRLISVFADEDVTVTWKASLKCDVGVSVIDALGKKLDPSLMKTGSVRGFLTDEEAKEWLEKHKDNIAGPEYELTYAKISSTARGERVLFGGDAFDAINAFTRAQMNEAGFMRRIMPAIPVSS